MILETEKTYLQEQADGAAPFSTLQNAGEIIEVTKENILAAAQIHAESWKESHKSFCSKEFVELHTPERQREYLQNEMQQGKELYMLIEDIPVGIVSVKGNLIENLYVLPDKQRMGYGSKLLKFAIEKCEDEPVLWILSNNKRAENFYCKHGFTKSGNEKVLSEELSELEMRGAVL